MGSLEPQIDWHRDAGAATGICDINHVLAGAVTDASGRDVVQSETRQSVVWLSEARQSFFRRASASGRRPVLVSDGLSELTQPVCQALRRHRGGWAVRGGDGVLRNGLTGRRMARVGDSLDLEPVQSVDDLALSYLRPQHADHAELMVSVTQRHEPGPIPLPGEAAEIVISTTTCREPTAYGRAEPALEPWDAAEIGWLCDRDAAAGLTTSNFIISGADAWPLALVLTVERGRTWTDQHVNGLIGLGALTDPGLAGRLAAVDEAMAALSRSCDVTFALVSARAGNRRLTRGPLMPAAPAALAAIVGERLVQGLAIDVGAVLQQFSGATAHRGHGLAIPFGTSARSPGRLPELLQTVDFGRATRAMGVTALQLRQLVHVARY
ncbi:MAG: DUF6177 family protein [Bifidobacteriaceae bacterium]|jgi:hypothetical protein|nr:DUF6177 family protein [Bifidobacteriaceae bacterium]